MSTCVQNLAKLQSYRLLFIKDSVCLNSHMISTFIIDLISSHTHTHTHISCCAGQTDPDWRYQTDLHRWRNQAHKSFSHREGQLNPHTWYETCATTSGEMPGFKPKEMAGKWKKRKMKKRKQIPQHLDPSQNNFYHIQPPSSFIPRLCQRVCQPPSPLALFCPPDAGNSQFKWQGCLEGLQKAARRSWGFKGPSSGQPVAVRGRRGCAVRR